MDGPLIGSIIGVVGAITGPVLIYLTSRRSTTTDNAQNQIDQIQEDREADRKQFNETAAKFEARQARLEQRVEGSESMFRLAMDYILQLRYHITEGKQPPPPPFPPELTRGMPGDR